MTFGETIFFFFAMLLASAVVSAAIFAGAIAVSFFARARPVRGEPDGPTVDPEVGN